MSLIVPAMFGVGYAPQTGLLWVAVAFLMLFGLGWGFFDSNNMPILCQIARPELRATGYGIMNLVSISCGGFADWGFGALRDRHVPLFGIFGVFASAAIVSIVLVLLIRPRYTGAGAGAGVSLDAHARPVRTRGSSADARGIRRSCRNVCLAARTAQVVAREPRYTEVYTSGEKGYNTFRIPSVIGTARGTLLAFAEGRRDGAGDAGDIDLVLKRSEDGGVSWSPLQVVGDNGPNTFGNPCPVVDRTTGTIWLLTTQNRGTDREKDIIAGTSQAGRSVAVLHSTDDGVTWSAPADITASVKRADWTWYATGPGVGIQTGRGRLVIPANHAVSGTAVHHSHVIFSDDGGRQLADRRQRRRRHQREPGRRAGRRPADAEHAQPSAESRRTSGWSPRAMTWAGRGRRRSRTAR